MKLLGWDIKQWAIAISWFQKRSSQFLKFDLSTAFLIHKEWASKRNDSPGEITLAGAEPDADYRAAIRLFSTIAKQC